MKELPARRAGAPGDHLRGAGLARLVEAADQRRQDVGVLRVVVVARTVEVRRHRRVEEDAVLLAVVLAELQSRDLRDRVGLVRRLQRTREEAVLRHRLGRVLGVDARAAEEEDAGDPGGPGPVDRAGRDRQVLVQEVRGEGAVGVDAAHLGRGDDGDVGLLGREECRDGRLARQVQLLPVPQEELRPGLLLQPAHERRTHHPVVASDEDLCHGRGSLAIWDSRLARSRSWSTIIFTSPLKRTVGFQPSCLAAFAGSPIRSSTSAGRS